MIWFLALVMLLTGVMYAYIARRLHLASSRLRWWLQLYLALAWLSSPAPLVLHDQYITGDWVDGLTWFAYMNLGFFSLLMVTYAVLDLLHIAAKPFATDAGRRAFFKSSAVHVGVWGSVGMTTGIGFSAATGGATVKEVRVPLGAPEALQALSIVQFTDLHVGPTIKRDYVQALVNQINALDADIVVMTGDLVDGSVARLKGDIAPLADIQAKRGKYFVTGNHEYYSGAEDWIAEMRRLGFTVLLNAHEIIEVNGAKLLLAGVTDYRAHRYIPQHQSSPKKAMAGGEDADVKILLAHQPKSIFEATEAGFDLQISGHTHGGQYYPWNFIAKMANPYIKGLHLHEGKTWIYVSPGTGYWGPPIRLGNAPEITLIRLG